MSSENACKTSGITYAGRFASDERGIDNAEFLHCIFYDRECDGPMLGWLYNISGCFFVLKLRLCLLVKL